MGFRIQDLVTDVWPGRGLQLANERCTCAASANTGAQPGNAPVEIGIDDPPAGRDIPDDEPVCRDVTLPTADCPPEGVSALAANLGALKAQLRRDLGLGPVLPG